MGTSIARYSPDPSPKQAPRDFTSTAGLDVALFAAPLRSRGGTPTDASPDREFISSGAISTHPVKLPGA